MRLPVHQAAVAELEEAIAFYDDERPGLGLELLDEVEAAVSFAVDNPRGGEACGLLRSLRQPLTQNLRADTKSSKPASASR